jgi:uncharacterized protein YkwD
MKPWVKQIVEITIATAVVTAVLIFAVYVGKWRYERVSLSAKNVIKYGPTRTAFDDITSTIQNNVISSDTLNPYFVEQYVNNARQAHGLKPLKHNSELEKSAKAKLKDMVAQNYFAHTSPTNKQPWDFMTDSSYNYQTAGENLAKADYKDEQAVIDAWLESPDHYAVMMSPKYCDIGIATTRANEFLGQTGVSVIVMHVGTRHDTAIDAC